MTYDAVIFDLFGTLVPSVTAESVSSSLREMALAVGAEPKEFRRLWSDNDVRRMRYTGVLMTPADNVMHICRRLGVSPEADGVRRAAEIREAVTRMWLTPREDAVHTLRQLRRAGLKLGLMSVASGEVPDIWPETPFDGLFDKTLFSCEVGLVKPDPALYERACEALAVSPEKCLYVGDGAMNELTGALRAGMDVILICPPAEREMIMTSEDAQTWNGPVLERLSEALALLKK